MEKLYVDIKTPRDWVKRVAVYVFNLLASLFRSHIQSFVQFRNRYHNQKEHAKLLRSSAKFEKKLSKICYKRTSYFKILTFLRRSRYFYHRNVCKLSFLSGNASLNFQPALLINNSSRLSKLNIYTLEIYMLIRPLK